MYPKQTPSISTSDQVPLCYRHLLAALCGPGAQRNLISFSIMFHEHAPSCTLVTFIFLSFHPRDHHYLHILAVGSLDSAGKLTERN